MTLEIWRLIKLSQEGFCKPAEEEGIQKPAEEGLLKPSSVCAV